LVRVPENSLDTHNPQYRAFHPEADAAAVVDARTGETRLKLERVHSGGLFAGRLWQAGGTLDSRQDGSPRACSPAARASTTIGDPFDLLGLFQGVGLPFRAESAPTHMPNRRRLWPNSPPSRSRNNVSEMHPFWEIMSVAHSVFQMRSAVSGCWANVYSFTTQRPPLR